MDILCLLRTFLCDYRRKIMEHVLATIESHVSPEALAKGTPEGLKTGHINAGMSLYEAYSQDDNQASTTVELILSLADTLTQDQFATACKDAQQVASNTDAALGFAVPTNAKGADKYGPKRKIINARMSEAKALFGVQKMNPDILKEKGYWSAVASARDFLDSMGKKWDGDNKSTKEQVQAKKAVVASDKAVKAAMESLPREPGESLRDWLLRGGSDLAEEIQEEQEVSAVLQGLYKMGSVDVVLQAMFKYIAAQGQEVVNQFAQDLNEQSILGDAPF